MEIKTISAKNTDEGSDAYMLLCAMHQMAGQMAVAKIGGWELSKTATFEDYVLTVWTNGIIDLTAETHKYWNCDTHRYQLSKVIKDEE
jgi:uncharacterized protein YbcV (DUF1398 family)